MSEAHLGIIERSRVAGAGEKLQSVQRERARAGFIYIPGVVKLTFPDASVSCWLLVSEVICTQHNGGQLQTTGRQGLQDPR